MLLRLRIQLVSASHRANLDPALFRAIARHQLIERSLHDKFLLAQRLSQLFDGRRLIRRINDRFQCSFSFFVRHEQTPVETDEVKEAKEVEEVKEKPNPFPHIRCPRTLGTSLNIPSPRKLKSLDSVSFTSFTSLTSSTSLISLPIFLINLFYPARLIKNHIKRLPLLHHDLSKLLLLR